jgi:hypothetical protein
MGNELAYRSAREVRHARDRGGHLLPQLHGHSAKGHSRTNTRKRICKRMTTTTTATGTRVPFALSKMARDDLSSPPTSRIPPSYKAPNRLSLKVGRAGSWPLGLGLSQPPNCTKVFGSFHVIKIYNQAVCAFRPIQWGPKALLYWLLVTNFYFYLSIFLLFFY